MRRCLVPLLVCFSALSVVSTLGATLDLVPSRQTVKLGDEVVVFLHVSGLEPGTTVDPAVGGFDIDVVFGDSNQTLKLKSAVFGPHLGDPADATQADVSFTDFGNFVGLVESTYLSDTELDLLQSRAVTLVTLRFKANAEGTTVVSGDLYLLEDQFGAPLIHTFGPVGSARITVVKGKQALPPSFP